MVISILMVILGGVAMSRLPIAQFPNIVPPAIQVNGVYTGADAVTVEQSVATPHRAADVRRRQPGLHVLRQRQRRLHDPLQLLRTGNRRQHRPDPLPDASEPGGVALPADVNNYGVTVAKSTSAPLPHVRTLLAKGTYDNVFLANYSYININDQMTRIKGIASVSVFGAGQYAMRHLGSTRPAGEDQHNHPGNHERRQAAEHGKSCW